MRTIHGQYDIRNLDDALKQRLRVILHAALSTDEGRPRNLATAIRARIAQLGGIEFDLPSREASDSAV
ncbi:hypothetical protein [Sinorhizobium fredii]|uniref:hypothetical protein n=1 Tax=Rhizobium fredii TaxID=380 RepID=UPI0035186904